MILNVSDFAKLYQETKGSKLLLDIRTTEEVASGKLKEAKHIPLSDLGMRTSELDSSSFIFVYCRSGGRAQTAYQMLQKLGFKHVVAAVSGGYEELRMLIK